MGNSLQMDSSTSTLVQNTSTDIDVNNLGASPGTTPHLKAVELLAWRNYVMPFTLSPVTVYLADLQLN